MSPELDSDLINPIFSDGIILAPIMITNLILVFFITDHAQNMHFLKMMQNIYVILRAH